MFDEMERKLVKAIKYLDSLNQYWEDCPSHELDDLERSIDRTEGQIRRLKYQLGL